MQHPFTKFTDKRRLICLYNGETVEIISHHHEHAMVTGVSHLVPLRELTVRDSKLNAFITTYDDRQVFPYRPVPADYNNIKDIAYSLARINRYNGTYHGRESYSVAQHSVYVSWLVPQEHKLAAILHDAPEKILNDLPSPLKHDLQEYLDLEKLHEKAACEAWNLTVPLSHPAIKEADRSVLYWEAIAMKPGMVKFLEPPKGKALAIPVMTATEAENFFLQEFSKIKKDIHETSNLR